MKLYVSDVFGKVGKMRVLLILYSLIVASVEKNEEYVIQALSNNIGNMVLECQNELEFTNEVIQDLMDFWNEKNSLTSQDLGCVLVCVFQKNEFLNEDASQVLAGNVIAFYKASGADDFMAQKMLDLFQLCKKSTRSIGNLCDSALEMAKCFRYGIIMAQWAPEPDYWVNQTEGPPGTEPEQVSDDQSMDPAIKQEMNRRRLFASLFRSCRK